MNKKIKKPLLIITGSIAIFVVIVIIFISPITKHLIEKYDKKYTGREITLDWAYVNPFTGYIHLQNLKIFEFQSDSVFLSANSINLDVAITKLFSRNYEISNLELIRPRGIVIQNSKKHDLNFSDIIERFSSHDTINSKSDVPKSPVHFAIRKIIITEGELHYNESVNLINYFIKKVNIESPEYRWDSDTIAAKFSFVSGTRSGDMKGDFKINTRNKDYNINVVINKFDLNIFEQYLKQLTNYGSFSANLDADIKAKGNFNDAKDINASGLLEISDFHFGKNPKDDYAAFDKLVLAITELSPKNHKYDCDSVSLSHPFFKYERYNELDNYETMFGKNGTKLLNANIDPERFNLIIEIANYIKSLADNFFKSTYKINRLAIYNGDFQFNDYSLSEKFAVEINPLFLTADSIDKNHRKLNVFFKSGIKPFGNAVVNLSIDLRDSSDFDVQYHFQKMPVSMFNPYLIAYSSYPLARGTIDLKGTWNVRNGNIKSKNHLLVIDPLVNKRLRNKGSAWIPLPLVMFIVRERGNVIDYEIPITGNLKDPKFHLHDVLMDAIKNTFVKPPTTPYGLEVKTAETEIENSLSVKWEMRQNSLERKQEHFVNKMADFLSKNPDVSITVYPQTYAKKEKEYILFFEAKKKYFLLTNHKNAQSFSEKDSKQVERMSVKDNLFIKYLKDQSKDSMLFTTQEQCLALLGGTTFVNSRFDILNKERENSFNEYFKKKVVERQVRFAAAETLIPYNGFSYYKIEYHGELPISLISAFRKMNDLNDEAPRKKFNKERKRIKIF